jgi:pSer/pThr/pTyr-binding forkhead associated (FHA) protein
MKKYHLIDNVNRKEKDITKLLEDGGVFIGRAKENDFTIAGNKNKTKTYVSHNSEVISRKHARIYLEQGNFYLEDLNSTNGTKIHYGSIYKKIKKPTKILEGYEIYLGEYGPILFT